MNILEIVNHFWPDTIAKLALRHEDLPDGLSFMEVYVELFEGAPLPSEGDVRAKQSEYEAHIATEQARNAIKQQIIALENTIPFTRKQREAILDIEALKALDKQIAVLRGQLE